MEESTQRLCVADTLRAHIEDLARHLEMRAALHPIKSNSDGPGCVLTFEPPAETIQDGSVICPRIAGSRIVYVDVEWLRQMHGGVSVSLADPEEDRAFDAICRELELLLRRRGAIVPTTGKSAMGRVLVWAASVIGIEPVGPLMSQPVGPDNRMVWAKLPADQDPRRALAFAVKWFLERPVRLAQYENLLSFDPQPTAEEIAEHLGIDEKYVPGLVADAAESTGIDAVIVTGKVDDEPPSWDSSSLKLSFGGMVVRSFKNRKQARNVVAVLEAFQSNGWTEPVGFPLTGRRNPEQLRETVKSLNDGILGSLKFCADGSGENIIWSRAT